MLSWEPPYSDKEQEGKKIVYLLKKAAQPKKSAQVRIIEDETMASM